MGCENPTTRNTKNICTLCNRSAIRGSSHPVAQGAFHDVRTMKKTDKTKTVRNRASKRTRAVAPAAFVWGEAAQRGLKRRIEHLNLLSKCIIPGRVKMTREQFEVRLASIQVQYQIAFESAKTLATYGTSADVNAKQRRMNMMVQMMILQLEEESGVVVAVYQGEELFNHTPFPPRISWQQTMINWDRAEITTKAAI